MRCLRPCDLPKLLSLWSSRLARRSPSLLPRCAGHRGLFVAPTLGFRLLYAFIIVRLARRIRLDQRHTSSDGGLDRTPDHGSPWQNGFAERLIGSIRRECLDHVIALGGVHLRGILQAYARYYNDLRTAPIVGQRRAILAPGSADRSHQVACCSRWTASPVHASLSFRYTQVGGVPTFWAPLRGRYIRCGILPRPAQKDMRALDQKDVVRLLRSEVKQEGSQKTWAKSTVLLRQRSAWFFRAIGRRTTRSLARSNSAGSLYSNELMNRAGHPATATPLWANCAISNAAPTAKRANQAVSTRSHRAPGYAGQTSGTVGEGSHRSHRRD